MNITIRGYHECLCTDPPCLLLGLYLARHVVRRQALAVLRGQRLQLLRLLQIFGGSIPSL